jgi:2,4-didehydro-3-deoxy-L-rhamnonate hydrolase
MKLIRFGERGKEKPGILINGKRYDCSARFNDWDHTFFQHGGLNLLQKLVEEEGDKLPVVSPHERWASPVARPGAIVCAGLNYADHAKETNMPVPSEPIIFTKATNTLSGPYDPVVIPPGSTKTDYEIELAIVIGKDALYLKDEAAAYECIAGFTIANDVSEREFQLERGGQWVKGKSSPGFTPLGPFMALRDDIAESRNMDLQLTVNNSIRQIGNTETMIFHPSSLIWYISQYMQLEAGDVILTGTPPGVGMGMQPPQYLENGDNVELIIEGLGTQKQVFVGYTS